VWLRRAASAGRRDNVAQPHPQVRVLPYDDVSPDPLAPPLSLDDVITFHYLLENDATLAEAVAIHAYGV
jgi:hypothetical protein